jgi:hypothetical protein
MEFANEIARSRYFRNYFDFETIIDAPGLLFAAAGVGAANTVVAPQTADQVGVVQHDRGTTTTGSAGWASSPVSLRLDSGNRTKLEMSIRSGAALSDGTDRYTVRAGFLDSVSAEPTDGVFFRYSDNLSAGVIQCVTRANGVETVVASGVTFAVNTTYKLNIEVLPDGSKAFFAINGVPVASQTLTIPVGAGRETGYGAFILGTLGTTSRSFFTDYSDVVAVSR